MRALPLFPIVNLGGLQLALTYMDQARSELANEVL
jgi:hypothetical protein